MLLNESIISEILLKSDFKNYGFVGLSRPLSMDFYKQWLSLGYQGDMTYLERHVAQKEDPQKLLPQAHSAIVVTPSYFEPARYDSENPTGARQLRMARYSQGTDYHLWFKGKLKQIALELKKNFREHEFLPLVDTSPVLEREYAMRAGLGWIGKNCCVINEKRGSFFFIGEIYTTLELSESADQAADRCGTCRRCIEACPTQALVSERLLDATQCISYLTIESKSAPPETLRQSIGDWFFGCDICQDVCPWNLKLTGGLKGHEDSINKLAKPNEDSLQRRKLIEELRQILESSNRNVLRLFKGTSLLRAGPTGLKRNALVVIANKNLTELQTTVGLFLAHPKLGELAQWTLNQLNSHS